MGIVYDFLRRVCLGAMLLLGFQRGMASTTVSVGSFSGSTLWYGWSSSPSVASGTYWSSSWVLDTWPRPNVAGTVTAPTSSLTVVPLAEAPAARYLKAYGGEFFLLDESRRVHVAPAQRPAEWQPVEAPPALAGEEEFSFYNGGLQLLTEDGFGIYDPFRAPLGQPTAGPALTPAQHPFRFLDSQIFIRPGVTWRVRYVNSGYGYAPVFSGQPNTGLVLPRLFGDAPDAPLRAHSIAKIVRYSNFLYALADLHPETPGYAAGTQAILTSGDSGDTWILTHQLPAGAGRWHDFAIAPEGPLGGQIVVVGDGGIYTVRAGSGWLSISSSTTTANATPMSLQLPPRTDAPLDEAVPLQLHAVTWAGDRFIAAGRSVDSGGQPVYVEGLSRYWFAYPLRGWPQERTVDQIETHLSRMLLLSRATDSGAPALLAADVPVFAEGTEGSPPALPSELVLHPVVGTSTPLVLHSSGMTIRRYLIEGDGAAGWSIFDGRLSPPYSEFAAGNYFIGDEPTHLSITAINEFGRSAPISVEVAPVLPAEPFTQYQAPEFVVPESVRFTLGAAVRIPVKRKGPDRFSWLRTRAYGLPAGLTFDPDTLAIVGHALEAGTFEIHLLTMAHSINGGYRYVSFSKTITLVVPAPVSKPVDAGTFTGLLKGAPEISGQWTATLTARRSFTGKLLLPGGTYSFRGTLVAETGLPDTFAATVILPRKGRPAVELELVLHAVEGRLALYARSGAEESEPESGAVSPVPWTGDRLAPRAGAYLAAIKFVATEEAVVVGQGVVSMTVGRTGKTALRGELANGLKWTASTRLTAEGEIPVFWKASGGRVLQGLLAFSDDSSVSTGVRGYLDWATQTAEKCPDYGDVAKLAVAGERAPVAQWGGALLESGSHDLVIRHPDLTRFDVAGGEIAAVFDVYERQPFFARYAPNTNPFLARLKFDTASKFVTGTFTVTSAGSQPARRKIPLRGALIIDPDSGETSAVGYFLLPAADGKTLRSGEFYTRFRNH